MLYDTRWDAKIETNPFTLESLIAWLEKQPSHKTYNFTDCDGRCLYSLYLLDTVSSPGLGLDEHRAARKAWLDFHHSAERKIAEGLPWTLGAALQRARSLVPNRCADGKK